MTYDHAIIIGRFQPFHNGHIHLIKRSLEIADKISIGIGSANVSDDSNPLTLRERKKMIEIVIEKGGFSNRVIRIVGIDDFHNDNKWLSAVKENITDEGVIIGNNEWTNKIMENAGYPVYRLGYVNREELEGITIRKLISSKGDWKRRVPGYLISYLEKTLVPRLTK